MHSQCARPCPLLKTCSGPPLCMQCIAGPQQEHIRVCYGTFAVLVRPAGSVHVCMCARACCGVPCARDCSEPFSCHCMGYVQPRVTPHPLSDIDATRSKRHSASAEPNTLVGAARNHIHDRALLSDCNQGAGGRWVHPRGEPMSRLLNHCMGVQAGPHNRSCA
jgi:hypothetical protein